MRRDGVCTCGKPDCQNPAKHPRTQNGLNDATSDPEQIRQWWAQWPDANIGIRTGEISGLVVVDIDTRHGATLDTVRPIPPTAQVRTGSGGWHLYFRYPVGLDIRNSNSKIAKGVDIRANGGYVVAPLSLHQSGSRYEWAGDGLVSLADLPPHLLQKITAKKQRDTTAAEGDEIPEGQRNSTLARMAGNMRHAGFDEEAILAALKATNENRCDPPLDDAEVERIAASISRYEPNQQWQFSAQDDSVKAIIEEDRLYTDTGNALRLAQMFGGKLRHTKEWGWLVYENGRWVQDAEKQARGFAIDSINDLMKEALTTQDRNRSNLLRAHAQRSYSSGRLKAMLEIAAGLPGIAAHVQDFDSDPYLLNIRNGTINLRTGKLQPHNPADLLIKQANVDFDTAAIAPRFEQFIKEVFGDSQNLINYIQRVIGYALVGQNKEEVFFMAYGTGANGKSTLFSVVSSILGDYAQPLKADSLMKQPHGRNSQAADPELAALVGARLVTASEPSENRLDMGRIKELTGGETMQVRELHKAPFKFRPGFALILSTNEPPNLGEYNEATRRRMRLLPFNRTFTEKERDLYLKERLLSEASGILNWMIAGALAWLQSGLTEPAEAHRATEEYIASDDEYYGFFNDVLVADSDARMLGKPAFEAFKEWARDEEVDTFKLDIRAFYKLVQKRGIMTRVTGGKTCLLGVRMTKGKEANTPPDGEPEEIPF
jgi:putative DNA primase/helicase